MPTILLSAVEPSADAMGADLMRELYACLPDVRFVGCGGGAMAAAGLSSAFDTSALSVVGLGDAAKAVPEAFRRARQLARLAVDERADAAVLIDAWGFSKLVAARMGKRAPDTALVKLATPQVWASRPGRAAFVRDHFDLALTLFPFEPPLFEGPRTRAVFVGNPNFEAVAKASRSGAAFRARHGLGGACLLAVLPGSRKGEVSRLMPVFGDAVRGAAARVPGLKPVIVAAPAVEGLVRDAASAWDTAPLIVPGTERFDAFDASDAALAASGTVTTELALCGVPMTVGYRTDRATAAWARRVVVTPYVSILNVAACEAVIPERLQEDCTPEQLCADVVRLLTDDEARRKQLSAFRRLLPDLIGPMTDGGAAGRAAAEIAALVAQREGPRHLDASPQG